MTQTNLEIERSSKSKIEEEDRLKDLKDRNVKAEELPLQ